MSTESSNQTDSPKKVVTIPPAYINEQAASQKYGLSTHWFRRARWEGGGPAYCKISGGKVLYPVTELDAFFSSRMVKSTSEYKTPDRKASLGRKPKQQPAA